MKHQLIISVEREAYNPNEVHTITARDLRDLLSDYNDDTEIIISFDNGYTYGGLHYGQMEERTDYSNEEEQ